MILANNEIAHTKLLRCVGTVNGFIGPLQVPMITEQNPCQCGYHTHFHSFGALFCENLPFSQAEAGRLGPNALSSTGQSELRPAKTFTDCFI